MAFYFDAFEQRVPPEPLSCSPVRELAWQYLATISLTCGAWYIVWRWGWSLHSNALWFAIPLALAETVAYIGMALFVFNLWWTRDTPTQPPPAKVADIAAAIDAPDAARPLSVDVFIATCSEDPELVRLSIRDAKRMTYPHPIDVRIHVLDDERRPRMKQVTQEEAVGYITRSTNEGGIAGNLRHGVDQTSGDLIVICDADTRLLPTFLDHTLGYFRDPDVAWVQTPQWFFDVDPFGDATRFFYDVLQRRRNWANASFCGGAGSVHRREAVTRAARLRYADVVHRRVPAAMRDRVSEDIYASILLHADRTRRWKSVLHPRVESKTLSPRDRPSRMVQRFKYVGGSLSIALHDNPVLRRGLTLPQRLMYAAAFWTCFGCLWNVVLLTAPLVFLLTAIAPVRAYSVDFLVHALPFLFFNEVAMIVGLWGIAPTAGRAISFAFFPVAFRAPDARQPARSPSLEEESA